MHPLDQLPTYTSSNVRLWNWFNRAFVANGDWRAWINEVCVPLLDRCVGHEIVLHRSSAIAGQGDEKTYRFKSAEISLGRDNDNDIVLTARSVAPKHCRVISDGQAFALEDLGSPLGMYLNKRKVKAHEHASITEGDEFSIFPYRFRFSSERVWLPESNIKVECSGPEACDWTEFTRRRQLDAAGFAVPVYPSGEIAYLETSRSFLEQVLHRFLRPLGLSEACAGSCAAQAGLLEFLVLALIERANKTLSFPFSFGLLADRGDAIRQPKTPGLELRCSIGLSQLTGFFRIFLPDPLLTVMMGIRSSEPQQHISAPLAWRFPISTGRAEFTPTEIAQIETGDIVLLERQIRLLFPGIDERGWTLTNVEENDRGFRIDKYFERFQMSEKSNVADIVTGAMPDVGELPVRLDVVLAEKEFTLREIQEFDEGSIVAVDTDKLEPVQVKLNGRTAGDGELVEIDGRLGVRILRWRHAQ